MGEGCSGGVPEHLGSPGCGSGPPQVPELELTTAGSCAGKAVRGRWMHSAAHRRLQMFPSRGNRHLYRHSAASARVSSHHRPKREAERERQCPKSLFSFSRGCVPQEEGTDTSSSRGWRGWRAAQKRFTEPSANNRSRRKLYKHALKSWLGFTAPCG